MRIAVCVKQVPDPETPPSQFKIDEAALAVVSPPGVPPVVNGFDLNAVEAALRVRETLAGQEVEITVLSVGTGFVMDVMKRPLSMGADRLVLVDDPSLAALDAVATVKVLAAAIRHTGPFDIVMCGRQASDWDQATVPLGLAEALDLPCVTLARSVQVQDSSVTVERVIVDGHQVIEAQLPALITFSNELGEPRYPNLRGIMAASRKTPETLTLEDLEITASDLEPALKLTRLFVPESGQECEFIEGEDDADAGRRLAVRLREAKLI
ncbi:MAG: electron transfer flavoprotein subunit beta/FixA family protein [Dehalococcoidia bacterium]